MSVSLLNFEERGSPAILGNVFEDIGLNLLVTPATLKIFSCPCAPRDILARQEIFRAVEEDGRKQCFDLLYSRLFSLVNTVYAYNNAKTQCEKLFMCKQTIREYADLVRFISEINIKTALTEKLAEYAKNLCAEKLGDLEEIFSELSELLKTISALDVLFNVNVKKVESACRDTFSDNDALLDSAEKLGLKISKKPNFEKIRLSPYFSDLIAKAYPKEFTKALELEKRAFSLIDLSILSLKNDLDFYFDINNLVKKAAEKGVKSCYADISNKPEYYVKNAYDAALISQDIKKIVPNDIDFDSVDSVFLLTGANGGGKTSYLRACAINLVMFLAGAPVFGERALIYPFKKIFTHFPSKEGYYDSGRFEEEKKRIESALTSADTDFFAFMNETFSGTDEFTGGKMLYETAKRLKVSGSFALFVTHFVNYSYDGLPILNAVVDEEDNTRTFRIRRSEISQSAHAADILKKYGLDRLSLEVR